MRLFVAIPTYKRFNLLMNLVSMFINESGKNGFDICINIYDNDADKSAANVSVHYPEVNYINYPVKGLSNIRNRILDDYRRSSCEFLLMIDDDQMISSGFLDLLLNSLWVQQYDVVSANIMPKFLCDRPSWTYNNPIYWDSNNKLFGEVLQIYGAGCVVFGGKIRNCNISFRSEFNHLGGEDTAFFTELKKSGFTFYVAKSLVSYEIVDRDRATYSWFMKRCIRIGVSEFFVEKRFNSAVKLDVILKSIIIVCCLFPIFSFAYFVRNERMNRYVVSFLRHIGRLNAALGFYKSSY